MKAGLPGPGSALDMGMMRAFKVWHGLGEVRRREELRVASLVCGMVIVLKASYMVGMRFLGDEA